jgi:putative Mg2+ transporter-C (MgtC) family protein
MITRIALGAVLGGVIGYERDRHRRPVGLRTHLIVAMTAATFMVISSQFVYLQRYGKDDLVEVDSSRIAASVVSGIGFLAGGAILRTGVTIQGLTTAAGLWLSPRSGCVRAPECLPRAQ